MNDVEQNLANWGESLFEKIPVGGLLARNPVAHKWKAPFRAMALREAAFWRQHDLMRQSYALHQQEHGLGARILLRSGFETLGTLIYLNILMQEVLNGRLNFHDFGAKTAVLLLGSRNNDVMPAAINIVTVLGKCDIRYPGLMKLYADLSESAHPNYEGLLGGYSTTDHDEFETKFSNRWMELHGDCHLDGMHLCMMTFTASIMKFGLRSSSSWKNGLKRTTPSLRPPSHREKPPRNKRDFAYCGVLRFVFTF